MTSHTITVTLTLNAERDAPIIRALGLDRGDRRASHWVRDVLARFDAIERLLRRGAVVARVEEDSEAAMVRLGV